MKYKTRRETGLVPKTPGPRNFSKKNPNKVEAHKRSIFRLISACQFRKENVLSEEKKKC